MCQNPCEHLAGGKLGEYGQNSPCPKEHAIELGGCNSHKPGIGLWELLLSGPVQKAVTESLGM